jgi:glycosyltransferase involved in cell wall biosynthesis
MPKAKILISTRYSIFDLEGTTIRAKRVLNVLKDHFDVNLITRAEKYESILNLDKKKIFIVKPKKTKLWPLKIVPILLNQKFDIVICENDWLGFPTYWIFSKLRKYKLVFEVHGILSEEAKDWGVNNLTVKLYELIEKFCIKNSDLVIALSEEIKNKYSDFNVNVKIIPVFLEDENYNLIAKNEVSKKFKKRVGIIGPFGTTRNEYYSLNFIYDNINRFDKNIKFIVIGKCEKKIDNSQIDYSGYIQSTKGYIELIKSLDAALVIEKKKTSGPLNKILEPMSLGVPVFTTPKGIFGLDYAKNCFNIFVFKEKYLVQNLNRILFNSQLMEDISKNAKETTLKYYSEESNKNKLIYYLNKLLKA